MYDQYLLPIIKTKFSARFDFSTLEDIALKLGEFVKIKAGFMSIWKKMKCICLLFAVAWDLNKKGANDAQSVFSKFLKTYDDYVRDKRVSGNTDKKGN